MEDCYYWLRKGRFRHSNLRQRKLFQKIMRVPLLCTITSDMRSSVTTQMYGPVLKH